MHGRFFFKSLTASVGICFFALPAAFIRADVNSVVGSGPNTAQVIFNWPDQFVADYTAHYSSVSGSIDGYDLTQLSLVDPNLSLTFTNYGAQGSPDYFLNIASYAGGHTGDGATFSALMQDNYWHEYYNDGAGWVFGYGASVDTIVSGGEIGWVFGSDALPVPEPTTMASGVVAAALLILQRRQAVPNR